MITLNIIYVIRDYQGCHNILTCGNWLDNNVGYECSLSLTTPQDIQQGSTVTLTFDKPPALITIGKFTLQCFETVCSVTVPFKGSKDQMLSSTFAIYIARGETALSELMSFNWDGFEMCSGRKIYYSNKVRYVANLKRLCLLKVLPANLNRKRENILPNTLWLNMTTTSFQVKLFIQVLAINRLKHNRTILCKGISIYR